MLQCSGCCGNGLHQILVLRKKPEFVARSTEWRCKFYESERERERAMAVEVDIAIVGGGLGGLALALGLQERGLRAYIFEKAPKVRPHHGTTISLALNGLRALDGIKPGLSARMMTKGTAITSLRRSSRVGEEPPTEMSFPSPPGAFYTIPWKSAQETLADEIEDPGLLHWRHTFLDYTIVEGGVEARFDVPAEDGIVGSSPVHTKVVRAKMLVGVDGMQSQVRKIMVGDEPRDLLHITWNAVVPTKDISSLNLHGKGELRFFTYKNPDTTISGYILDAGPGLTLWQVRTLDASGEIKDAYPRDLQAHGRAVRKARALRQVEGLDWLGKLNAAIDGTDPDSVREARACDRLPLTSWSDSSKRVVLLGDAAHGMYPGPGEGARTAFEDAHQLSLLLHEAFASPTPAIPDAVKKFEEMRIPRTTKFQAWAAEQAALPAEIPEWVRGLSPEQQMLRRQEFSNWAKQYPEAMAGDPNSTYWKP